MFSVAARWFLHFGWQQVERKPGGRCCGAARMLLQERCIW
jgi:hypothetical protein